MTHDTLPTTRKDAKASGSLKYFPGTTCKRGHTTDRYTSSGGCVICSYEDTNNRDKQYSQLRRERRAEMRLLGSEEDRRLPSNKREARERGENKFFNGVPCRRGHVARRYTLSGCCVVCQALEQKNRPGRLYE